jgi:CRP/FNR family cyclic AMP-dependent transcriptional regulator
LTTEHSKIEFENLGNFLTYCHKKTYSAKSSIVNTGEASKSLFYLIEGSASVIIEDEDGHEIIVAYLNSGEFFGEMGLFDEHPIRTAWVRAKTQCIIAEISYKKFESIIQKFPKLMFTITSQIVKRLSNTTVKVRELAFMDVSGRIASTLLQLCKEPDALTHPKGMQIKITRQEISHLVGCTREVAGRVLKNLEQQGLISAKGKTIVVFDI